MGKNKLQKFDDISGYEHVFQYPFARLNSDGFPLKGNWKKEFFKNDNPIVLELGCGKGEYTVGLAQRYPAKNFIGVDIKGARIWSGAKQAKEQEMGNVAFLRTTIELIAHFFAVGEVSEIWITFPDPQMKKVRKRLTSTRFMQLYSEILTPDGLIHLKTDSDFLYTYTTLMVAKNHLPIIQNCSDLYDGVLQDDILAIKTHYEQQWLDRGLTIKYLQFKLIPIIEWQEPEEEVEFDSYRSYNRSKRSGNDVGE